MVTSLEKSYGESAGVFLALDKEILTAGNKGEGQPGVHRLLFGTSTLTELAGTARAPRKGAQACGLHRRCCVGQRPRVHRRRKNHCNKNLIRK